MIWKVTRPNYFCRYHLSWPILGLAWRLWLVASPHLYGGLTAGSLEKWWQKWPSLSSALARPGLPSLVHVHVTQMSVCTINLISWESISIFFQATWSQRLSNGFVKRCSRAIKETFCWQMVTFGRNLVAPKTLVQAQVRKSGDSGKNCLLCSIHSLFHQSTIISNSTRLHSQRSGWHNSQQKQNNSQQKLGKRRSLW